MLKLKNFYLKSLFYFSSKSEKIIKPEHRVVTNLQSTQETFKDFRNEYIKSADKLLSKSTTDKKTKVFSKRFAPISQKLNKVFRKNMYKSLEKNHEDLFKNLEADHLNQLESNQNENRRKIEEIKEFNKRFFIKNEIIRQIRKQELNPENFLPSNEITHNSKQLEIKNKFLEYKENINKLKNIRIENVLSGSSENKKLGALLQSGLLDNDKNIQEVMIKSMEILKNSDTSQELENLPIPISNDKNKWYAELIKNMNLELDKNLSKYDFDKLAFYLEEITQTNQLPEKIHHHLSLVKKIRAYEQYLIDNFQENNLCIRAKGRLEFKKLTEEENINYVKYNIETVKDLFLMYDNCQEVCSPAIAASMIQKISIFRLKQMDSILYVIKDNRYRAILRYMTNNLNFLNNNDFVNTIWALGKIHKDEFGLIYKKLYIRLIENIILQIDKRLDSFSNVELSFLCRAILNLRINFDKVLDERVNIAINKMIGKTDNLFSIFGFLYYLAEKDYKEINIIMKIALISLKNEEIIKKIDKEDIMDVCYLYSRFLNRFNVDKEILPILKDFMNLVQDKIILFNERFNLDEISSLLLFISTLDPNSKKIITTFRKRLMYLLEDYAKFHDFSLSKISMALSKYDLRQSLPNIPIKDNIEWLFLGNIFPIVIIENNSPRLLPYHEIAKKILENIQKIKEKNLLNSLLSIISIKFQYPDFFLNCFEFINKEKKNININSKLFIIFIKHSLKLNKKNLIEEVENLIIEEKLENLTTISILNLIFMISIYDDPILNNKLTESNLLKKIIKHYKLISQNNLIVLLWSLININFNDEIFADLISKINLDSNINQDPLLLLIINQILYLNKNPQLLNWKSIIDINKIQNSQKFIQNNLENTELSKLRRPYKAIKDEIINFINENFIISKDYYSNSNILLDLYISEHRIGIKFFHKEHFFNSSEGKLLKFYENEIKILKEEGLKVLYFSLMEYELKGSDTKTLGDEKNIKKNYIYEKIKEII